MTRFLNCLKKCQSIKKKKIGFDLYVLKEEILSYPGTLHFGTLCVLASDLPSITHAELTASAIPHLTVVPDDAFR